MVKQNVYIAYSRTDKIYAERLYSLLNRYGIRCFQVDHSLEAGMDFATSIQQTISNSKIVIVVCSKSAEQSAWLKKEIEFALSLGKTIVPVTDEADLSEFKGLLNLFHGYKIFRISEFERKIHSFGNLAFIYGSVDDKVPENYTIAPKGSQSSPISDSSSRDVKANKSNGCFKKLAIICALLVALVIIANLFLFSPGDSTKQPSVPDYKYPSSDLPSEDIVDTIASIIAYDSTVVAEVVIPDDPIAPDTMAASVEPTFPTIEEKEDSLELVIQYLRFELDGKNFDISRLKHSSEYYQKELKHKQTDVLWLSVILLLVVAVGCWLTLKYRKLSKIKSSLSLTADINGDGKLNEDNGFLIMKGKPSTLQIDKGNQKLRLDFIPKNKPKRLSCFIAGSTALQPERDAIRSTISVVYNRWKDKNFQILSYTYEDFTSKVVENGQQSLYNRFIENEADIAVFIIKGFIGDKTIEEFEVAYNAYSNNKHLSIVVYYFPEGDESESVKAIKTKVQSRDQYWITVANIREMKFHFTDIINTDVWNLYTDEL